MPGARRQRARLCPLWPHAVRRGDERLLECTLEPAATEGLHDVVDGSQLA